MRLKGRGFTYQALIMILNSMKLHKIYILIFAVIVICGIWLVINSQKSNKQLDQSQGQNNIQTSNEQTSASPTSSKIDNKAGNSPQTRVFEPIYGALNRVTKKPFGIDISPKNSPVSPERFSGFHTGVDFETTAEEENIDIDVKTICEGELVYKNWVSGYGGVVIEKCSINEQVVTVLYGHIKLSSVPQKVGTKLTVGEKLAVLGKGASTETDGERKHLHLGIHKGGSINLLGYVKQKSGLVDWLDVIKYLSSK